jgi:putative phosphoribosyl transferase
MIRSRGMIFKNRQQAGQLLARELMGYENDPNAVVLGLPRGGIPVAYEVAKALKVPLDVLLVRKLGVPGEEELAMGALAFGGTVYLNKDVIRQFAITESQIQEAIRREEHVLEHRNVNYRRQQKEFDVAQKIVILVDDGLATGATMQAAIALLHLLKPQKIIVAVPVAPESTCEEIKHEVNQLICLYSPQIFYGVGSWYADFTQTSDEEVCRLLQASHPQ